jgi:hypothetical protein
LKVRSGQVNSIWKENVNSAVHATRLIVRERHEPSHGRVGFAALGCGFWIAPQVFISNWHIFHTKPGEENSHKEGDQYHLIRKLPSGEILGEQIAGRVELDFHQSLDLAFIKVPSREENTHLVLSSDEPWLGQEVGLAGYPFAKVIPQRDCKLNCDHANVHTVRTYVTSIYPILGDIGTARGALEPQMVNIHSINVAATLPYGFCGAPCFDVESGHVLGIGLATVSVPFDARLHDTEQKLIRRGGPEKHIDSSHFNFSRCVKLTSMREHDWLRN